jgi:septum formation inhibitor MinC
MTDKQVTRMLEELREAFEAFEKEFANLSAISKVEQLQPLVDANNRLQELLTEAKAHFSEVRSSIPHEAGIPPAKELAQLVIGGATEALRGTKETQQHLQEFQESLGSKLRSLRTSDAVRFADLSAKEVQRATRYIIKRMTDFLEKPPKQK